MVELLSEDASDVRKRIIQRLAFLELSQQDESTGAILQADVILPHLLPILNTFYQKLSIDPEFSNILAQGFSLDALKKTQNAYLRSLGINFHSADYFEERLKIGMMHAKVGVKPSLYQCSYRVLQQLLIDHIPPDHPKQRELIQFVLKITTLDMSLAIEAYQDRLTENLRYSVQALTDEKTSLSEELATDTLTGVLSRRRILEILEHQLCALQRQQPISVIMADLDHFKQINDQYGHVVGDEVLKQTANRIKSAIRSTNTLGRYGGEEFLIVLGDTNLEHAQIVANRIRKKVEEDPINCDELSVNLTLSLGIAATSRAEPISSIIDRADKALYQAKELGRNRVEVAK